MHHKEFITQLDEGRIEATIGEAEKKTSGEIRVYISHKERHDAMEFATRNATHAIGVDRKSIFMARDFCTMRAAGETTSKGRDAAPETPRHQQETAP